MVFKKWKSRPKRTKVGEKAPGAVTPKALPENWTTADLQPKMKWQTRITKTQTCQRKWKQRNKRKRNTLRLLCCCQLCCAAAFYSAPLPLFLPSLIGKSFQVKKKNPPIHLSGHNHTNTGPHVTTSSEHESLIIRLTFHNDWRIAPIAVYR